MNRSIVGWIIITIIFLLYIQFSPNMGNIWWRNNSYFAPMGAINVMIYPFRNIMMWKPEFWDINYPIWVIIYMIIIRNI